MELATESYGHGSSDVGTSLSKLFKRAYWSRIWVVQELVHPKRVEFVCGKISISDEPVNHALRLLRNLGLYEHYKSAKHPQGTDSVQKSWHCVNTRNPINILNIRKSENHIPSYI